MMTIIATVLIMALLPELLRVLLVLAGLDMPSDSVRPVGRKCGS